MLKFRSGFGVVVTILLLTLVGMVFWVQRAQPESPSFEDLLAATAPPPPDDLFVGDEILPPIPLPEFNLINHTGERVTPNDFSGRMVLLSFAYTSCPDTCPVMFGRFQTIERELGEAMHAEVELVFVTVDPEVDTAERLSSHVRAMGGGWYFLTEEISVMQTVWDAFNVFVEKEDPLVSHSNLTYLVDENGLIRVQYLGLPPADVFISDLQKIAAGG